MIKKQSGCYLQIMLSFLFVFFGTAGFATAEGNLSLRPCGAYTQFLNSRDLETENSQPNKTGCISYENFIMQAGSWREFQLRYERSINKLGYPIHVGRALEDWRLGRGGATILRLDVASSVIHQAMIKLGDSARAEVYIYLLKSVRNLVLADFVEDQEFVAQLSGIKKPSVLNSFVADDIEVVRFFTCLIRIDAMTVRIEVLLASTALLGCTTAE